jgi:hypothetical protein
MLSHYVRRPVSAPAVASELSRLNHALPPHFGALLARDVATESRLNRGYFRTLGADSMRRAARADQVHALASIDACEITGCLDTELTSERRCSAARLERAGR